MKIEVLDLDRLWDLYVAVCARDNTKPIPKDFDIWLVEEGYAN